MKVLAIADGPLAKFLLEQIKSDASVGLIAQLPDPPPVVDLGPTIEDEGPKLLKAGTDPVRRRRRRRHRG